MNDKLVNPAHENSDFRITTTGINTVLLIPAIHAKITFSGLIFGIYLPFSQFGGNTIGQCGQFYCINSLWIWKIKNQTQFIISTVWLFVKTQSTVNWLLHDSRDTNGKQADLRYSNNECVSLGTCDNNRTNDCMLPSGKIDPSCPNMAHKWHANNSQCEHPIYPTPTPAPSPCDTNICEVLKSR